MNTKEIVDFLKERETCFAETKTYSKLPGIYALFYIGQSFPIMGEKVKKHQIIYIGKTESSQEKRDLKTHFTSGKTGSSTVRKSIGSLLCQKENLNPIPRNGSDYYLFKFSHFKFDNDGEEKITKWMKDNLALSFYEFQKSKSEIEKLETDLIEYIIPILNISKNPDNNFRNTLKNLRKTCAVKAAKDFKQEGTTLEPINFKTSKSINNNNSPGKYTDLWQDQLFEVKQILENRDKGSIQMSSREFEKVGIRKSYSFNLEFLNGALANNISGSAVARDLARVLENDVELKKILNSGYYKFSMGKDYVFNFKRY
jgi:hypothetical protein